MSESKELTPQQKFEDRIKDKLRSDIGDLMPDDVLKAMVDKVLNDMFFEKRREETGSGWNSRTIEKPSWFEEIVKDAAKDNMKAYAQKWLDENGARIATELEAMLVKNGPAMMLAVFFQGIGNRDSALQQQMFGLSSAIDNIRNAAR